MASRGGLGSQLQWREISRFALRSQTDTAVSDAHRSTLIPEAPLVLSDCVPVSIHLRVVPMHEKHKPLTIPPAAEQDERAIEMVRAWIAKGALHCTLNVGHWHTGTDTDERQAWGIMLADLARQIAKSLDDVTGLDPRVSLHVMLQAFNAELQASATSDETRDETQE